MSRITRQSCAASLSQRLIFCCSSTLSLSPSSLLRLMSEIVLTMIMIKPVPARGSGSGFAFGVCRYRPPVRAALAAPRHRGTYPYSALPSLHSYSPPNSNSKLPVEEHYRAQRGTPHTCARGRNNNCVMLILMLSPYRELDPQSRSTFKPMSMSTHHRDAICLATPLCWYRRCHQPLCGVVK